MKKIIALSLLCLSSSAFTSLHAESEFKARPTGQLAIDGALYASPQKQEFADGLALPEIRAGVAASYDKWSAAVQIGYAYGKVGLKDTYIQYTFNPGNYIRVGNFIHYFGLQSLYGALSKPTMNEMVSANVFDDARLLGVMYVHNDKRFFASASAHVEPSSTTVMLEPDKMTRQGYGFRTRLAAHTPSGSARVAQIEFGAAFSTPQTTGTPDTHDAFSFGSNWPTKVARVKALNCTVGRAMNLFKFTPGLLLMYRRIALESQYYFMQVNRRENLQAFRAQGAYVMLRGMILGGNYQYSGNVAGINRFAPKSLEAIVGFDYTNLNDASAGIFGGRMNDLSVTGNYYINKYLTARLRYSYSHCWGHPQHGPMSLNAFQMRLQVIF